jgi:hypothetical protein
MVVVQTEEYMRYQGTQKSWGKKRVLVPHWRLEAKLEHDYNANPFLLIHDYMTPKHQLF